MTERSDEEPASDSGWNSASDSGWGSAADGEGDVSSDASEEPASDARTGRAADPDSEEPDAGASDEDDGDEDEDGYSMAGVFGARDEDAPPRPEIRPESLSPENALFVVLGVALALLVVYRTAAVLTV